MQWVQFLRVVNGTWFFLDLAPTLDVATDACSIAVGGYFRRDWFYHNFLSDSPAWDSLHINHKETLAIVLGAKQWDRLWSNQRAISFTVITKPPRR